MSNILQSDIWATFQESNGHRVFRGEGQGWSYLATLEGGSTGRYLYAPYGPVADSAAAFEAAIADMKRVAAENKYWFIRVEPTDERIWGQQGGEAFLKARGFKLSPRQIQPAHTQIIDLDRSEDEIFKDMKSTNRNLHRNIHKKGVTFEASQDPADMAILFRFLDETATRTGFNRQRDEYLMQVAKVLMPADAASLYIARVEDEPIAAAFVYDSDDTRTYAHAAASFAHRKLSAGIPLVTNFIVDAKAKGLKYVDLFGIAPENEPDHEWAGFTKFKKSFGGRSVAYPGTWDLPVNALQYKAYTGLYAAKAKAPALKAKLSEAKTKAAPALQATVPAAKRAVASVRSKLGK
ncbi:peptidoglycan bridge formation glycyltransferase FemA/FemB family protein [Rothia sp. LK2588]|uniref:lipid II:glycine glycyltransferase FemX n=1 Tax=Rothia sp. LK2588 TaxID=3114369 RepID=UPI0034CFB1D3